MVSWCNVGVAEIIKLGNCKMTINTNITTSAINERNLVWEEKFYEIDLNRGTIKAVEILTDEAFAQNQEDRKKLEEESKKKLGSTVNKIFIVEYTIKGAVKNYIETHEHNTVPGVHFTTLLIDLKLKKVTLRQRTPPWREFKKEMPGISKKDYERYFSVPVSDIIYE